MWFTAVRSLSSEVQTISGKTDCILTKLVYQKGIQDWIVLHPNRELCIDIERDKKESCLIPTEDSSWLYRNRQDWTVPHPNREFRIVIPKKTKLKRIPSQQRTLHCHIEKDKTEPFPIPIENSVLLHRKRQDWTVPHPKRELWIVISKKTRLNRSPSQQRTLLCYIEKDKTESFPIPTENSALLHQKRQDWTVPHANKELCIVISKKTRLNRSPSQQRTLHC